MTKKERDPSRISFTAHVTGYVWFANGLSHDVFATRPGRSFFYLLKPWMLAGRHLLGIPDLEISLIQRHLVIDHLLDQAVTGGVKQVLELACGLSPRGLRFKQKYPEVTYVEADLPDMASRKRKLLEKAGLTSANHHVRTCNILSAGGPDSLEQVAAEHLDPAAPTAVITEGLIIYFDRTVLDRFWKRLGKMPAGPGSCYITDNIPIRHGGLANRLTNGFRRVVGLSTGGRMYAHFETPDDARRAFQSLGFRDARVYRPEDFAGAINVPASRRPSLIRVIQAWMDSSPASPASDVFFRKG